MSVRVHRPRWSLHQPIARNGIVSSGSVGAKHDDRQAASGDRDLATGPFAYLGT